jgi:hypothetical protein
MSLSNNIWITRKSRIEAAERLASNARHSQHLVMAYSVFIVVLSILDVTNSSRDYGPQLLIASVVILSASLYIPSVRFADRAGSFKNCYLKLDLLYKRLNKLSPTPTSPAEIEELSSIEKAYNTVLAETENHSHYDYCLAVWRIEGEKGSTFTLTKSERIKLYTYKLGRSAFLLILFILPFLLFFYL